MNCAAMNVMSCSITKNLKYRINDEDVVNRYAYYKNRATSYLEDKNAKCFLCSNSLVDGDIAMNT